VEHALSEVASSISSFIPRPGPQRAWLIQVQIWLLLAEIYLEMGETSSASACVHEAALIFPLSHHVLFTVSTYVFPIAIDWESNQLHGFKMLDLGFLNIKIKAKPQ